MFTTNAELKILCNLQKYNTTITAEDISKNIT